MATSYPTAPPSYSEVLDDPNRGGQLQTTIPATQVELSVSCKYVSIKLHSLIWDTFLSLTKRSL